MAQVEGWRRLRPKSLTPADSGDIKPVTVGGKSVRVNAVMASKLQAADDAMFRATGQHISINQSFRTREEQAALYAKFKSGKGGRAAPPGSSFHERGLAVDVSNWQAAQPYLRAQGLLNSLPDDRGHYSLGEFTS